MRLRITTLLLLTVSSLCLIHGILEVNYTNRKCKCSGYISERLPLNLIQRLQIIPPGNGCPNKEVILWTPKGKATCLNPEAKWVQKIIRILKSRVVSSTAQAPVSKKRTG